MARQTLSSACHFTIGLVQTGNANLIQLESQHLSFIIRIIMETVPFDVQIYETEEGRVPFSEWLTSLKDAQAVARILLRIDRAKQGNLGDRKLIADGMLEFRIDVGAGYRVYFGRVSDRVIVILWGGDKSSQSRDIEKAQQYWIDYRSRDDA